MMHRRHKNVARVNNVIAARLSRTLQRWLRMFVLTAALACCSSLSPPAQAGTPDDSTVTAIRAMYENGAYLAAEVEARRYLEQQTPADSLRITGEQYLAFALVAQGKSKAAVRHFTAILEIDSTFELDPVYTSPKILASFNEARQLKLQSHRIDSHLPPPVQASPASGVSWRSIVFPGWEQVYQGRESKGYALIAAGVVAAGSAVVFEIERSYARSEYIAASTPGQASARYDRYNRANKAETYSLIAFAAIYLCAEIDAFLNLPVPAAISLRPGAGSLHLAIRF